MLLLPPPKDSCPACGYRHEPHLPHNADTMYYKYRFYGLRGRWPTWKDAVAHCEPSLASVWEQELKRTGHWTEPPEGVDVIADPPAESINQPIGDINSPNFGPEGD